MMSPGDALVQAFFSSLGSVLTGFLSTLFSAIVRVFADVWTEALMTIVGDFLNSLNTGG